MNELISVLIEAAPFGGFCLAALWIQQRANNSAQKRMENIFDKSLETIKNSFNESLVILKDAQNNIITGKIGKR